MRVTIRPAETEDRATIEAASRQTWQEHRARQPDAFAEDGWEVWMGQLHANAFRTPEGHPKRRSRNLFVADANGDIVGFVLLSWHLGLEEANHPFGSVDDIWVAPAWRKKGIGRELLDFAKEQADAAGWHDLTAQVWRGAPSADLFERVGFAERATIWRYGPDAPAPRPPLNHASKGKAPEWQKWAGLAVFLLLVFGTALAYR